MPTLEQINYAVAKLVCERLTDEELAAINNVAQVDWNPTNVKGYEKVKHLFTEKNGTKMHEEIKESLARVVLERLSKEKSWKHN